MLARERAELEALYARVERVLQHSAYGQEDAVLGFVDRIVAEAIRRAEVFAPAQLTEGLMECVYELTRQDPLFFWMPVWPDVLTIEASASLRSVLTVKERVLTDPARYEGIWTETDHQPARGVSPGLAGSAGRRAVLGFGHGRVQRARRRRLHNGDHV